MSDLLAFDNNRWQSDPVKIEPRLRDKILDGYRELLELTRYLGNRDEERRILARIADLEEGRP